MGNSAVPQRPGDSVWAEYFRRMDWNATYSHKKKLFAIHGDHPIVARATLALTGRQLKANTLEFEQAAAGWAGGWTGDLLLVGSTPLPAVRRYFTDDAPAGLIGVRDGDEWRWSAACWALCDVCRRLVIYNDLCHGVDGFGPTIGRPCGHVGFPVHLKDALVPKIGQKWAAASYAVAQRRAQHEERKPA